MKNSIYILALAFVVVSCKENKKSVTSPTPLSIAEKIANANGFKHWKDISEIDFTFNVDRDSSHFERSWNWKPKTSDVTLISGKDTISYNRKSVDSLSLNADKGFINDKFWLLAPFQLVWDKGTTISEPSLEEAPISKQKLNKITLTYTSDGGYTPGDAYDFYYGDDFLVKEWIYRKGNSKEPSMITSWENYEDFNGLKIAKEHKKPEGNWKLYFSNIKVKFN
ncbi:hypothetical protein [Yeosuana marina]|uniref:hypothetical protein n=1 Tax=Yeosuana marina TaxID=1565536 RepID=UPI0030EB5DD2|tara:strand:+ start:172 stop:840 length:669 start_codon:yes stop_codon:yes gene_type:complete